MSSWVIKMWDVQISKSMYKSILIETKYKTKSERTTFM